MRIYYINIEARTDRRKTFELQLVSLGLKAQRIKAVTPPDLSENDKKKYCDARKFYWLSEAELACSLSHVAALNQFIESGEQFCLIFEDDVLISASLKGFIKAFEADPPELDILRIENNVYPIRMAPTPLAIIDDIKILRFYNGCDGSAGYIASRRAAKRIVAGKEMRLMPADRALFNPYDPLASDLTILQAVSALCKQESKLDERGTEKSNSDIAGARLNRTAIEKTLFPRRVIHEFRGFIDREFRVGTLKTWHQFIKGAAKQDVPFKAD